MSSDKECSICLENLDPACHTELECGHVFHANCIVRWVGIRKSCPLCRAPASSSPHIHVREDIANLLAFAQDPALFRVRTTDHPAFAYLSVQEKNSSFLMLAVQQAREATRLLLQMDAGRQQGDSDSYVQACAMMLVYLHMAGDPRAAGAAGERTINIREAAKISARLSDWHAHSLRPMRPLPSPPPQWHRTAWERLFSTFRRSASPMYAGS